MIQTRVSMNKLGEFVADELHSRDMSLRDYEKLTGISYGVISKMMLDNPPDPELETLVKLANATHVDLCTLVAMVKPEAAKTRPDIELIASRLLQLDERQLERLDNELVGIIFKSRKGK